MDLLKFDPCRPFVFAGYETAIWKEVKIIAYVKIIINIPGPKTIYMNDFL